MEFLQGVDAPRYRATLCIGRLRRGVDKKKSGDCCVGSVVGVRAATIVPVPV